MDKDRVGPEGDAKPMGDANLLLFLNLSGELFYIVAHRMKSQDVNPELQQRVFNDLSLAITAPDTIHDLLTGRLKIMHLSYADVRARMNSIVHSTIMKINDYSMERLFELTLIATKYQFVVCVHPSDILLIVLNHLDAMRAMVSDSVAQGQMAALHDILVESYSQLPYEDMAAFRGSVLNYVLDVRLKMTNLINLGLQLPTGEFVKDLSIAHSDCVSQPCRIQCYEYDQDGKLIGENVFVLEEPEVLVRPRRASSLEHYGDRVIALGQSIYDYDLPAPSLHPVFLVVVIAKAKSASVINLSYS